MPKYDVRGVNVEFPYTIYEGQKIFMEKVVESLQGRKNALLESPTGTGKTLCLLCSSLAWREHEIKIHSDEILLKPSSKNQNDDFLDSTFKANINEWKKDHKYDGEGRPSEIQLNIWRPPTIIYASRTHSQLTQVVKELKNTGYSPKVCVLGSRNQLCVHPEVSKAKGEALNQLCRNHVLSSKCDYHAGFSDMQANGKLESISSDINDIEDLVAYGKDNLSCPFYISRELQKTADIIFMPYNYLLDQNTRRSMNLDLDGAVVILDEAHNLETVCTESASFELTTQDIHKAIKEVQRCMELVKKTSIFAEVDVEDLEKVEMTLLKLQTEICNISLLEEENENQANQNQGKDEVKRTGFTASGSWIFELFEKANMTEESKDLFVPLVETAVGILTESMIQEGNGNLATPQTGYLAQFLDILKLLFGNMEPQNLTTYYRIHISKERVSNGQYQNFFKKKDSEGKLFATGVTCTVRKLSFFCLNSGVAMQSLLAENVRNIILASGTLAPLDSFAFELMTPFPIRLEGKHVVPANHLWVGVIQKGPTGERLNSNYNNRKSPHYRADLGNMIVNFCKLIPRSVLVFFPSYDLMSSIIGYWKDTTSVNASGNDAMSKLTIWERICKNKEPVVEPRESYQFAAAKLDYETKVQAPKGAVFFAVCRGKVSEGIDFSDDYGRAVIITGLPYPSYKEPKVLLKKDFLNEMAAVKSNNAHLKQTPLTADEWYAQQAMRAVNQCCGRIIRHRNDYGAIILCDERFSQSKIQNQMSLWIRPQIKVYTSLEMAIQPLVEFFKTCSNFPVQSKPVAAVTNVVSPKKESNGIPPQPRLQRGLSKVSKNSNHGNNNNNNNNTSVQTKPNNTVITKSDTIDKPPIQIQFEKDPPKPELQKQEPQIQQPVKVELKKSDNIVKDSTNTKQDKTTTKALDAVSISLQQETAAKTFVKTAKAIIPYDDWNIFHQALLDIRAKRIKLVRFVAIAKDVFDRVASTEKREKLYQGVTLFLPASKVEYLQKLLREGIPEKEGKKAEPLVAEKVLKQGLVEQIAAGPVIEPILDLPKPDQVKENVPKVDEFIKKTTDEKMELETESKNSLTEKTETTKKPVISLVNSDKMDLDNNTKSEPAKAEPTAQVSPYFSAKKPTTSANDVLSKFMSKSNSGSLSLSGPNPPTTSKAQEEPHTGRKRAHSDPLSDLGSFDMHRTDKDEDDLLDFGKDYLTHTSPPPATTKTTSKTKDYVKSFSTKSFATDFKMDSKPFAPQPSNSSNNNTTQQRKSPTAPKNATEYDLVTGQPRKKQKSQLSTSNNSLKTSGGTSVTSTGLSPTNNSNNNNYGGNRISPQSNRTSPQISPQNNNKTVITLSSSSVDEGSQQDYSQPLTSTSPPKPNPLPQPVAAGANTSQFKCPVCLETCKEPHAARCGHICCYACWAQCLETKLECPVCRERLRLKQLTKLFV